jgi:uncharacterized protein
MYVRARDGVSDFLNDQKLSKRLQETFVVDVDVHLHETPDALAPYCDQPWRESLEYIATLPQRYLDVPGFAPVAVPYPLFPGGERRQTVSSPDEMRNDLDRLGIDVGLLFPNALLLHAAIRNADYAVAVARAYNRWITEEWIDRDRGLIGAVVAPNHDPVAAAAEIRRYADNPGIRAVYLPTSCVEPLWGSRTYDPIYVAAQEANLAVILHSVAAIHPAFPMNMQGFDSIFGIHSLSHGMSMAVNLVHMIESGVPVRFPRLRIAFTEAGISWVPWVMMRMDKEFIERRRDVPFLSEPPSHYVKKMWFATQPIEEPDRMKDVATLMSLFDGEDRVVFASDWPHHDFDHPSKVLQIPISNEAQAKIMGLNALKLFDMEMPVR